MVWECEEGGKTSKLIHHINRNGLKSSHIGAGSHPSDFHRSNDIADSGDVTNLKDLRHLIRDHARFFSQLIIRTTLSEDEIRPFEPLNGELTPHKFRYLNLNTITDKEFDNVLDMLTMEWKVLCRHKSIRFIRFHCSFVDRDNQLGKKYRV